MLTLSLIGNVWLLRKMCLIILIESSHFSDLGCKARIYNDCLIGLNIYLVRIMALTSTVSEKSTF